MELTTDIAHVVVCTNLELKSQVPFPQISPIFYQFTCILCPLLTELHLGPYSNCQPDLPALYIVICYVFSSLVFITSLPTRCTIYEGLHIVDTSSVIIQGMTEWKNGGSRSQIPCGSRVK